MSEVPSVAQQEIRPLTAINRRISAGDGDAHRRAMARVADLGLQQNLLDIHVDGYTVIRGVLSPETVARATAAILRRVERRHGRHIDPASASTLDLPGMQYQHYLLFDDPVFEEILLEPKPLAIMNYLLGESCVLSSMGSHVRGPGGLPLALHADGAADGLLSKVSMVANCNYALTPYSRETGAVLVVPRSHEKERQPATSDNWMADGRSLAQILRANLAPEELNALEWTAPPGSVTMNLEPGDAIIWHGNTWHGGWRRELPGVRMNLSVYMCRQHMMPQERRHDTRYPEAFERHKDDPRFAQLLGEHVLNGWREDGPDPARHSPVGIFD